MADIRINSLPTTASASSSDDFLALDGATNGTRKLNAYSPTFGGNLTVNGGTVDNSPASGGPLFRSIRPANTGSAAFASIPNGALSASNVEWYSGLIGSSGDYKIWAYNGSTNTFAFSSTPAGNVTLAGNLTVSGTGTSTFSGNVTSTGSGDRDVKAVSTAGEARVTLDYYGAGGYGSFQIFRDGTRKWRMGVFNNTDANPPLQFYQEGVGEAGRFAPTTGNLLIGGTIDGGQKLQVSGTAYVSGNFTTAGYLGKTNAAATGGQFLSVTGSTTGYQFAAVQNTGGYLNFGIESSAGGSVVSGAAAYSSWIGSFTNTPFYVCSNSAIALTLDSSQRVIAQGQIWSSNLGNTLLNGFANATTIANNIISVYQGTGSSNIEIAGRVTTFDGGSGYYGLALQAPTSAYPDFSGTVNWTNALTLTSQNATFAGTVTSTGTLKAVTNLALTTVSGYNFIGFNNANNLTTATGIYSATGDTTLYLNVPTSSTIRARINGVDKLTVSETTATFANSIAIGNTVNTVSPTSPNRTITMVIGGTTYYIHAKTTND